MKPIMLKMNSFGSYAGYHEIDFRKADQNFFLIQGDTGSGKSTIFDAIVYALYGEVSSDDDNKKGEELQSRFTPSGASDEEPYVELVFTHKGLDGEKEYRIKRVPSHIDKDGTSKSESVELFLPGKTEAVKDDIDSTKDDKNKVGKMGKIEKLIGLNKSQFMQVAMIAQGEFVKIIRASSDQKKNVFRKLFDTEVYLKIAKEFDNRKKDKNEELGKDITEFESHLGYVRDMKSDDSSGLDDASMAEVKAIFAPFDQAKIKVEKKLEKTKSKREKKQRVNLKQWDDVVRGLGDACNKLGEEEEKCKDELKRAEEEKSACDAEYSQGKELINAFSSKEEAEIILERCKQQEEEMEGRKKLSEDIDRAYKLENLYKQFTESKTRWSGEKNKLIEEEGKLPGLKENEEKANSNYENAKRIRDDAVKNYTAVEKNATAAIGILRDIKDCERALEEAKRKFDEADDKYGTENKNLDAEKQKLDEIVEKEKKLSQSDVELAKWEERNSTLEDIRKDIDSLIEDEEGIGEKRAEIENLQKDCESKQSIYDEKKEIYDNKESIFYRAQAGILAQKLIPGTACPVCGSTEHPVPCVLDKKDNVTEDELKKLKDLMEKAKNDWTDSSANVHAKISACEENVKKRDRDFQDVCVKLREKGYTDVSEEMIQDKSGGKLKVYMDAKKLELNEEGEKYKKNAADYAAIKKDKENKDKEIKDLAQLVENLRNNKDAENNKYTAAKTTLANLKKTELPYSTEDEANEALKKAGEEKEKVDAVYRTAEQEKNNATEQRSGSETIIAQCKTNIPQLEAEKNTKESEYQKELSEQKLTYEEWSKLVDEYSEKKSEALRKEYADYREKLKKAIGGLERAEDIINGRNKPDMEALKKKKDNADEIYSKSLNKRNLISELKKTDEEAYKKLSQVFRNTSKHISEFDIIKNLHSRLVGGGTGGGKLDLETFVQRHYMENILVHANKKFYNMTARHLQMKLISKEEAIKSQKNKVNKGLDLMVTCTKEKNERSIKTLSGGESFMAALSLAMALAEQIKSQRANVNMDMLFIDEGFGSLDQVAREEAVRILKKMAGNKKTMIGVISHVTELQKEFETKLLVRIDDEGSHADWE